jgi:hypothetical protein
VEAALSRVRFRRSVVVWVMLGILLAAIGVVEYRDRRPRAGDAEAVDARALLPVPVTQLHAVEIADRGRLHRFERAPTGAWLYHGVHTAATGAHTHSVDPALSDRIERAFAVFGRARTERRFELDGDAAAYGLTAPEVVIVVYRTNQSQPLAQYAVGAIAPDTLSRYISIVGRRAVVTIPNYQIDNLLALIDVAGKTESGVAEAR